jgi:Tfp pilus assembly protein PilO
MDDQSIEIRVMENGRFQIIDKLNSTALYNPSGYETKEEAIEAWWAIKKNKAERLRQLRNEMKLKRDNLAFINQLIDTWNVDRVRSALTKAGYSPTLESFEKEFHVSVEKNGQTYVYVFPKTADELLLDQICDLF